MTEQADDKPFAFLMAIIIISKLSAFVNKKVKAFVMFNRQNVIKVLRAAELF